LDRIDLLASIPMFEGLDDADLEALAEELQLHQLVPGDMVFDEGDRGDSMYIVAAGEVDIFLPGGEPTSRVTLAMLEGGTYFGEFALFDDKPRSASAQATCDTILLELGREALINYIETRPSAALGILRTVSERLRETNAMLSAKAARNAIAEYERTQGLGDRIADRVSALNGSWAFILLLAGSMGVWAVINVPDLLAGEPPDPYPYIFFNLLLAVLVAIQWPLIVMSQNRQAQKQRREAEQDFKVNLKNETNCEELLAELLAFRAEWEGREEELAGLLTRQRLSMLPPLPMMRDRKPPADPSGSAGPAG
jgi:CRP/FNR family transcriptional regulator, cyclic AMP receptor protein